ncbi:MAG: hypothetical protein ACPGJS_04115 [Flammeovirgaceae bacterium]
MKRSVTIFVLQLVLVLGLITDLKAQKTNNLHLSQPVSLPTSGYIITADGEKVYGKISAEKLMAALSGEIGVLEEIAFNTYSGEKIIYHANQIKGFSQKRPFPLRNFEGFTSIDHEFAYFQSMPHPTFKNKMVFAECVMQGSIQVYVAPREQALSEDGSTEDMRSYYVMHKGENAIVLTQANYAEHFESLFGGCDEMDDFLERHPQMVDFKSFHLLVELYNDHFACD